MGRDFEYRWGQLVARAWDDPAFKARLLAEPRAVLEENGLAPAGKPIRVVEGDAAADEDGVLRLPGRPGPDEISDEELRPAAHCRGCGRCDEDCGRCRDCRSCDNCRCRRCDD